VCVGTVPHREGFVYTDPPPVRIRHRAPCVYGVPHRGSVGSVYANQKGKSDQTSLVPILHVNIWVIIVGGRLLM
jgi:hypothetical protein